MKTLIVEEEALAEYREAASYYEAENPDVGLRFVEPGGRHHREHQREPHLWPLDPTVPARLGVRRQRVDGFPYSVVYFEMPSAIHVLAEAHGRRKPGYWRERLPSESGEHPSSDLKIRQRSWSQRRGHCSSRPNAGSRSP